MKSIITLVAVLFSTASFSMDIIDGAYGTVYKGMCGMEITQSGNTISIITIDNPQTGLLCEERTYLTYTCSTDSEICVNTNDTSKALVITSSDSLIMGTVVAGQDSIHISASYVLSQSQLNRAYLFLGKGSSSVSSGSSCSEGARAIAFMSAFKKCKRFGYKYCEEVATEVIETNSGEYWNFCRAESYFKGLEEY